MRLPPEAIQALIPKEEPSFIDPIRFSQTESISDGLLRNSYLWAYALLNGFGTGLFFRPHFLSPRIYRRLPLRTVHLSAGFVYINPQTAERISSDFPISNSFVFGLYALATADDQDKLQEVIPIRYPGRTIPLVINYGRIGLHGCPPHPAGGMNSCWVENASGGTRWSKGILASRHVVSGYSLGSSINLTPSTAHFLPSSGKLADIDACTIDAAVIGIDPIDWPPGLRRLSVNRAIAPGTTTGAFTDSTGIITSGSVLRVIHNSTYYGNLIGQRVITDFYGKPGDSGTLLRDGAGDGMGIYIGDIPDGAGGKEGLFQDLYQAKHYFGLDLYY